MVETNIISDINMSLLSSGFNSISGLVRSGIQKTLNAFGYVSDPIMNYGKCYMCMEQADCYVPCGHILCNNCLNFYIESLDNPKIVECYICKTPITLEDIPGSIKSTGFREQEGEEEAFSSKVVYNSVSSNLDEVDENDEASVFPIKEKMKKICPLCESILPVWNYSKHEKCRNVECNREFCPQCNQAPHPGKPCDMIIAEFRILLPHKTKCTQCCAKFIREEGCNFLWCPNSCVETCYCLLCRNNLSRCEYFTHYKKTGPFGSTCNDEKI